MGFLLVQESEKDVGKWSDRREGEEKEVAFVTKLSEFVIMRSRIPPSEWLGKFTTCRRVCWNIKLQRASDERDWPLRKDQQMYCPRCCLSWQSKEIEILKQKLHCVTEELSCRNDRISSLSQPCNQHPDRAYDRSKSSIPQTSTSQSH